MRPLRRGATSEVGTLLVGTGNVVDSRIQRDGIFVFDVGDDPVKDCRMSTQRADTLRRRDPGHDSFTSVWSMSWISTASPWQPLGRREAGSGTIDVGSEEVGTRDGIPAEATSHASG